jgi:hypothetical protein
VAYSSFNRRPPAGTLFGRVSPTFGGPSGPNLRVLCVNPAALEGRARVLEPYFTANGFSGLLGAIGSLPSVRTAWVSFPGLYRARCRHAAGVTWLQVDDIGRAGDRRPRLSPAPSPTWGLHLWDVNLALGNLVSLVRSEAAAYTRGHARRP